MRSMKEFIKNGTLFGMVLLIISSAWIPKSNATASTITDYTKHIGSTGHITGIKMLDSREWEYKTPEYVLTSLTLPMNYTNPWYAADSADGAKAVKSYYYLGTIIYNDKAASSTAGSYDDLSDDEKLNYDDMSSAYTRYQASYKKQGYSAD